MRTFTAAVLVVGLASGCAAPQASRPIAATDMVFGTLPVAETILRVKAPCTVPSVEGWTFTLPAGDYTPQSVDQDGIFYRAPGAVNYQSDAKVLPMSGGVHLPFEARPGATFFLWVEMYDPGQKRGVADKRRPVPAA